jgi:hypothetical protein
VLDRRTSLSKGWDLIKRFSEDIGYWRNPSQYEGQLHVDCGHPLGTVLDLRPANVGSQSLTV